MTDRSPRTLLRVAREDGSGAAAETFDLGQRDRSLRKDKKCTLKQVAQKAGLARSTSSKIENGQMSQTYAAFKKLAIGLDISVPQLFTPPQHTQIMGRLPVTKSGQGPQKLTVTYEHKLLSDTLTQKRMMPYRARICARCVDEFDGWSRHDGEDFLCFDWGDHAVHRVLRSDRNAARRQRLLRCFNGP